MLKNEADNTSPTILHISDCHSVRSRRDTAEMNGTGRKQGLTRTIFSTEGPVGENSDTGANVSRTEL